MEGTPLLRLFLPRPGFTHYVVQRAQKDNFEKFILIGMLRGAVVDRDDNQVCIMVGGIGHEVLCTLNALSLTAGSQTDISLWTHLIVREDVLQLYGFADKRERALFRELIRISGIGPKVALAVLSGMDAEGLIRAIHNGDAARLTKLPGIGKKTAERLIVEMRDPLAGWQTGVSFSSPGTDSSPVSDLNSEAEAALISLGYKPAEASRMLSSVRETDGLSVEAMLRAALQSRLKS